MKNIVLPQIVAVGIYNAQVALKSRTVSTNRKTTMFELELPIGDGGVSYIDDESHSINENTVICAKPGQIRHTSLPFKCYFVHMIVNEGLVFDMLSSFPNYIELDNSDGIKEIFVDLCYHYDNGTPENEIMLQSLLLKLSYTLNRHVLYYKANHSLKNNHEVIDKTIAYINENPSADLSLATLCERVNFSPVYFHKLFKASTGRNLHEYVEEQRIKKAINLLVSTNLTLTQIAYECGFSSQSYFSYAFKRRMGISPREYVKNVIVRYNYKS